ncbi:MAG: hypoxanthine-guanine phosphoribosyltransferase [Gammaproteobacteria bacterium]|nr:hypoxanthine-guanine phosphoribosyltransferase [Gammaproteobacteria bacterium]MDH3507126.1 hypoxanthine-guanine phosphoribosyltransferase [Gammaproteobacteria bacterium]
MAGSEVAREALEVREAASEIASAGEIRAVLDRLAVEITDVLAESCPVLLAIMHGGVFTAVELSRRLDFPHEFDYVHASRYGKALTGGQLDWHVYPRESLRGRHVLVVDDILDKGETLAAVLEALTGIGVERVYTAVLIEKALEASRPTADFVGLTVPDAYVFGCGMDYKGFWRGLSALYAVR